MPRANALGGGAPKRKPFTFNTAPKPRGGTPALYDRIGPGGRPQTKPVDWQVRSRKAAIANSTGSRSAKHSDSVAREPMRKRNAAILSRYERLSWPQKQSVIRTSLQKPDKELSRLLLGHVGGESKARQMIASDDLGKGVLGGAASDAAKAFEAASNRISALSRSTRPGSLTPQDAIRNPERVIEATGEFNKRLAGSDIMRKIGRAAEDNTNARQTSPGIPMIATARFNPGQTVGRVVQNLPGSALALPSMAVLGPADMTKRALAKDSVGEGLLSPVKDVANATKEVFTHPIRSVENDPVGAGIMFVAPVAATGRLGGMAGRSGLLGKGVRKATSTAREPMRMGQVVDEEGNVISKGVAKPRHYSKNVFVQAAQKAMDKRQPPRSVDEVASDLPRKNVPVRSTDLARELAPESRFMPLRDVATWLEQEAPSSPRRQRPVEVFDEAASKKAAVKRGIDPSLIGSGRAVRPETPAELLRRAKDVRERENIVRPETKAERIARAEEIIKSQGLKRPESDAELLSRAQKIVEAEGGPRSLFGPGAAKVKLGAVHEARRMGDEIADVTEVLRREAQRNAANEARAAAPYGNQKVLAIHGTPFRKVNQDANDIVSEVLSGSVLPSTEKVPTRFRDTLQSRLEQVKREQKTLRGAEKGYSKDLTDRIENLLKLSDKKLAEAESRIVAAVDRIAPQKNAADAEIINKGLGLDPTQAEARRLAPYAIRHMGARFDEEAGSFIGRDGNPLDLAAIKKHMEDNGVDPDKIAYVNTQQGTEGSRNFFMPWRGSRGQVASGQFTGATFRRGAFPSKFENLVEQAAKDAGLVSRAKAHDKFVSDFGIKKDMGDGTFGYFSGKEAKRVAASMSKSNPDGIEYQAIRIHPLSANRDLVEKFQSPRVSIDSTKLLSDWDNKRFDRPEDTDLSVIVPSHIVRQIVAQNRAGRPPLAFIGGAFRRTVLALHTTWMTGNIVEAALRSLVAGVNPNHYRIGKLFMQQLRAMDEEAAARLDARAIGGTMFGTQKRMATRSQAGIAVRKIPAIGQAITFGEELTNAIFAINRGIERQFQLASLGKHVQKEMQEFTDSWVKANQATTDLLRGVAEGYLDEAKQIEAARYVDDVLGKYSKFSPKMRQAIQGYAIFLPWALNAVRFFTFTLPIKHPVQSALLISSEKMIDQETKDAANSQPGNLRSELQVKGGVRQVGRYTPAGLFLGTAKWNDKGGYDAIYNPLGEQAAKQLLPEISTTVMMLKSGINWRNQKAMGQDGKPIGNRPAVALYQFLEGITPGLAKLRQFREGGGKPYDDSNVLYPKVKPGTRGSKGMAESLNPFRVIETGGAVASKPSSGDSYDKYWGAATPSNDYEKYWGGK